jgi:hypothetical protein
VLHKNMGKKPFDSTGAIYCVATTKKPRLWRVRADCCFLSYPSQG